MLGHTWVVSPNKVNDFKFGLSRLELVNGNPHTGKNDIVSQLGIPYVLDTPGLGAFPSFSSRASAFGDRPTPLFQLGHPAAMVGQFLLDKGKHSFKFGGEYMRTRFQLDRQ
jgi:hypothetical protein